MDNSHFQKRVLELFEDHAWWVFLFGVPGSGAILAYLGEWSSTAVIALTAVLVGAGIATTALLFWRRIQLAQTDSALKQAMLQRGLAPEEIERLVRVDTNRPQLSRTPDDAIEELAACLGECAVSAPVLEQIMAVVRAEEPPMRQVLSSAVVGLVRGLGGEADEEKILAVIRGLTNRADQSSEQGSLSSHGQARTSA